MARQTSPIVDTRATRTKVRKAFAELRKTGAIARMNFSCCMGCASSELDGIAEEQGLHRMVYYHKQDGESFKNGYDLHVRYCIHAYGNLIKPPKGLAETQEELIKTWGHLICAALRAEGLTVKWDGSTGSTIVVRQIEKEL